MAFCWEIVERNGKKVYVYTCKRLNKEVKMDDTCHKVSEK
jgi:hypothetical protein